MTGSIRNFEKFILPKIEIKRSAQGQTSKFDRLAHLIVFLKLSIACYKKNDHFFSIFSMQLRNFRLIFSL